jgi:spore coat polysaccharide biosynthesis protein SpsF
LLNGKTITIREFDLTGIVLQARIDSSRLPGKSLLPVNGRPFVFRVMEALNNVSADLRILTCPEDSYSSFEHLAQEAGFHIFAGPKEDVLKRFCKVIRYFSLSRIIRATADNLFVFTDAADSINSLAVSVNADYAAYTGLPLGAGVESVSSESLLCAAENANAFEREHVCPYLYNNPDKFAVHRPQAPHYWQNPDFRLTVDTQEDFDQAVKLYETLKDEKDRHNGNTIINKYQKIIHGV